MPLNSKEIADLIQRGGSEAVNILTKTLLNSNWPDCDRIARALAEIGSDDAKFGLLSALKGRRHHIRSAAIKALAKLGGNEVRTAIADLATDPAYEVRQDVAEALRMLDNEIQKIG